MKHFISLLQDDYRLLELVKLHGTKEWVRISRELGGKSRTQCRNRFNIIYNWYLKDPDNFNLNKMRCSSLQKKRKGEVLSRLETRLTEFLGRQRKEREEESAAGYRRTDLQGYHTTPEGVVIPMRDLHDFMVELRSELPGMEGLPEHMRTASARRRSAASDRKLGLYETKPVTVKRLPRGRVVTVPKSGVRGRATAVPNRGKKVNSGLFQFFRPTWTGRRGRGRVTGTRDVARIVASMEAAGRVLGCGAGEEGSSRLDLSRISVQDLDDMEDVDRWLTEGFVARRTVSEAEASKQGKKSPAPVKVRCCPFQTVLAFCRRRSSDHGTVNVVVCGAISTFKKS